MTDDERLEAELRAMFARRDPGAAPSRVQVAVISRLTAGARPDRFVSVGGLVTAAASIAALVVLAVAIASLGLLRSVEPAVSPSAPEPLAPTFGFRAGDGVADGAFVPIVQVIVWLIAFVAAAALVLRARARALTVAGTLVVVGLVWIGLNAGTSDALVDTGMVGSVDPSTAVTTDGDTKYVLRLEGDQSFRMILVLKNTSALPLILRGMVPSSFFEGYNPPITPRFVGFARLPDNEYTYDRAQPFQPVAVEPGGLINVAVLGMTGSCAIASAPEAGGRYGLETLTLVYDQLSIVHTAEIRLARSVWITARTPCPPEDANPAP